MAFTYKHGDRPLEGYQIQRGVGRGGFGEVYYAISDGGREVALKYLRENPEIELRGISSCINLKSPHLVSIFDVKQNKDGEYFVVMEYISGPSLRDLLISEPNGLGSQKAAFFTREIAKGLGYLHDRGIVHRDLKPGNIFYEDGYVKICDYGLSKFIAMSRHSAQTASVGTVHYMAPEVGSGNYSKTIDIYALGVVLYEMLLGRVPYEGASMGEVLMKHLTSQPEVDQLEQPFASVIRKALAKDPAERYQSVGEMVEAIFGEEDVRKSVSGFEPTSLTQVAAHVAQDVRPSPAPSDNPIPAGPRAPRTPRQPAGSGDEFSRRFVQRTAGLDPRMTKKERKRNRRRRKGQKKGQGEQNADLVGVAHDGDVGEYMTFGQRLARMFTALLVMVGASVVFWLTTSHGEIGGMFFAVTGLAVIGIGLSNKISGYLGPDNPWLIGRVLTLACCAPAVGALYGFSQTIPLEHHLGNYNPHIPMLFMLVLLDWRERIRNGAQGDLGWWEAFVAGLVMFIGAQMFGHGAEEDGFLLAGLAASISLVLQVWSWALVRRKRLSDGPQSEPAVHVAAGVVDLDETRYAAPPPDSDVAMQGGGPAGFRGERDLHSGLEEAEPGHADASQRGRLTRWFCGFLGVASACGALAFFIALLAGEFKHHDEEVVAAIAAVVGASMMSWLWLDKTRKRYRPGLWSEWFNPLLRVPAAAGLAACIGTLANCRLDDGEMAAAIIGIVLLSLVTLFLLILRRRTTGGIGISYSSPRRFDPDEEPGARASFGSGDVAIQRDNDFIIQPSNKS